jgi:hypothetical protein
MGSHGPPVEGLGRGFRQQVPDRCAQLGGQLGFDEDGLGDEETLVLAFSLNARPQENRLTRVSSEQTESLLGKRSLMSADQKTDLSETLQNHWSQPVELLPTLMILLLLVLALENLLANKFYRREPENQNGATPGGAP